MKRIERPQLTSAVRLTAREMNDLHFSPKHTVLTPGLLEKMSKKAVEGTYGHKGTEGTKGFT